jgi:SAM-dependent methyltransferase
MPEFTGERVLPDEVDVDLLNEHVARYAFANRLSRNKRVLDLGCGAGYGTALLREHAATAAGIDVSVEAVIFARGRYGRDFVCASCAALPFSDSAFDLVTAFELIEHVEDWRQLLAEARRVLAPGGQFVVSTPNKLYYAESRKTAGPNPFHVHEFEFSEFRDILQKEFGPVSLYVQNHAGAIVFQSLVPHCAAEALIGAGQPMPEEAHFLVAVCGPMPENRASSFIYVPKTANVLRERELHIERLQGEITTKDEWLEIARREHAELLTLHRAQKQEIEDKNRWAEKLNEELKATGERVVALQRELELEHAAAMEMSHGYEKEISRLSAEHTSALETAQRELAAKCEELAKCVDVLHDTERTLEERTNWALALEKTAAANEEQLNRTRASRWLRLGRALGLGPELG